MPNLSFKKCAFLGHFLKFHNGLTGEQRESNSNCERSFHVVRRAD